MKKDNHQTLFLIPNPDFRANPRLLGYYRLLLGFSQKDFYGKKLGIPSAYKKMESKGEIDAGITENIPGLCRALNNSAAALLESLAPQNISSEHLDDLTLR